MTLMRRPLQASACLVAAALVLAGCAAVPDPRLNVTASSFERSALWSQAATAEAELAQAYKIANVSNVIAACANWCPAAANMHMAHATVLKQPDPWGGFVQPEPVPTANGDPYPDAATAVKQLQQAAQAALTADQAGLAAASPGREALLWASLVAIAQADVAWTADPASDWPSPVPGAVVPSDISAGSTADASNSALGMLDQLTYTLTTASAQASISPQLRQQLSMRLATADRQRGALQVALEATGNRPSPPALAYPLPPEGVATDDAVRATWGTLEQALAVDYVRLAATMTGDDALAAVAEADLATATALGQPITWWAGWG